MKLRKIVYFMIVPVLFAFMFSISKPDTAAADFPRIKAQVEDIEVPEGKELILKVYTVQPTDSLVKIARRNYGDWKKWKIIYDYNEYIRDPHWIFPGDQIIVPAIVEKLPEVPEIEEPEEVVEVEDPREFKDFLAPPDFIFDASIIAFRDEKKMYAQGDYCFIDLGEADGISEGQKFNIYRRRHEVAHPHTGHLMGILMKKVGALRVTGDIEQESSTARIILSHNLIEEEDNLLVVE